jgi:hypothetical protein
MNVGRDRGGFAADSSLTDVYNNVGQHGAPPWCSTRQNRRFEKRLFRRIFALSKKMAEREGFDPPFHRPLGVT